MAESNGYEDNESRLDRVEREHEEFRAEHKMLLRSQVLFQDALEKLDRSLEKLKERVSDIAEKLSESDDKLNGLIGVVEQSHREFHERLKRLNG